MKNDIPEIMQILEKYFDFKERTTLNRMRINNSNVASVGLHKKMPPFSVSRKEREENQGVSSPFKILISCLLSLRARDESTEKVSKKLFAVADTPEKISKMPTRKLEKLIYSSGHYKKKARTLKHVSEILLRDYNGEVPSIKEELLSIKGIGPKTANIVLAFAYNQQVLPIDTHCHRIPNRLGWVKTATFVDGKGKKSPFKVSRKEREKNKGLSRPEQTEKELEKILPKKYWSEFNGIFVLFGRTICQPVSPWCSKCPIEKYCQKIGVGKRR